MSLKSYFFKPKGGKNDEKLVIVFAEQEKNIGAASSLAKSVGFKDMRATDDAVVTELLGCKRAEVMPTSITQNNSTGIVVILSQSLLALDTVTLHDAAGEAKELKVKELHEGLQQSGAQVKEVTFGEKGTEPPAAQAVAKKATNAKESSSKPATAAVEMDNPGLTIKKLSDDFGGWYQQVLTRGEMIDYYDVSGCYILRPASYSIWEKIQAFFDGEIKKMGVENTYFPMFVSQKVLEREKDHIEGFAPEVAWVTKAGQSDLEEPIAIRPTSETVMYPAYAKWIRSHRDLPLKLNQWNNVVRWEFKNPQPFLRTREFLWQEGHTAHLQKDGADQEVREILDLYRRVYEELLAVPVVPGIKSEKEKFAGGLYTTTVEGFIPASGRGIQGGTSHCLGQNFSKMFNITVEDPANPRGDKLHVWQNSWGLTTRTIGVMIMTHSDDKGLVIPPRVAQWQVVVIPTGITAKTSPEQRQEINDKAEEVCKLLNEHGVRSKSDTRVNYTPGYKYSDWEMKGICVRLEIGPQDIAKSQVMAVRRDNGAKTPLLLENLPRRTKDLLDLMQKELFAKAHSTINERLCVVREWKDFVPTLNAAKVCVIPWCEVEECEDAIKDQSAKESAAVQDERAPSAGAKSLCIPFDQERFGKLEADAKCTKCGMAAKKWTMFGRSY